VFGLEVRLGVDDDAPLPELVEDGPHLAVVVQAVVVQVNVTNTALLEPLGEGSAHVGGGREIGLPVEVSEEGFAGGGHHLGATGGALDLGGCEAG